MPRPSHMRFGIFLSPNHRLGENPTLALERDLELITWLDRLGFDEAWVGEHHSTGWDLVSSPELVLAVAAERTKHIRLGTGVVSLPYHHPFMVASRITLLDHLTRGRLIFGVGPGALATDAMMLGIDPERLRPRMAEALEIVWRLLTEPEPITYRGEWFELRDAAVQLRSFQRPHVPLVVASTQSPAGMVLAGKYGAGVLSYALFAGVRGAVDIRSQWAIAEESAAKHGKAVRREDFRLVTAVHVAESREQARADIEHGARALLTEYTARTLGRVPKGDVRPEQQIQRSIDDGRWIVGTPDDAVAGIERFQEMSGGFGALMIVGHDWAPREATLRSYELFARYVMPRFQGSLAGLQGAQQRAEAHAAENRKIADRAIESAHEAHAAKEKAAPAGS